MRPELEGIMATIWLKDKDGRTFHLLCNIIKAPEKVLLSTTTILAPIPSLVQLDNTYKVETEYGTIEIDFNVNGRSGKCLHCGVCCSHLAIDCPDKDGKCGMVVDGRYHRCEYLRIITSIGVSGGTECIIKNRWLYEGKKSCLNFPVEKYEIEPYVATCGFTFDEVK